MLRVVLHTFTFTSVVLFSFIIIANLFFCVCFFAGLIAESFLEHTASQLTYHGLCELNSHLKDEELCVFFRNNHFSTLYKHKVSSCSYMSTHHNQKVLCSGGTDSTRPTQYLTLTSLCSLIIHMTNLGVKASRKTLDLND